MVGAVGLVSRTLQTRVHVQITDELLCCHAPNHFAAAVLYNHQHTAAGLKRLSRVRRKHLDILYGIKLRPSVREIVFFELLGILPNVSISRISITITTKESGAQGSMTGRRQPGKGEGLWSEAHYFRPRKYQIRRRCLAAAEQVTLTASRMTAVTPDATILHIARHNSKTCSIDS